MPAVRDVLTETTRKGELLAYALEQLVRMTQPPPCRVCRENGSECPLCRGVKTAQAALKEWRGR